MLRVVAHKSAAAARQYYAESLKREDYYSEGQEIVGKWHGKAAERLGLSGDVTPEAFAALVENRHPVTGKRLTPRTKADRIVGYDINFHAPKSLSILHALTGDADILKAFRSAVTETMNELEGQTNTRIRQAGAQENRNTGNLAWAEFVHFTARPVGGIPDPHLHVHCFAFNATFDSAESRWKAAKFRQIKEEAPYNEAAFHARLASKLSAIGYGIRRTPTGWEIEGIPRSVIDKFSRRTAQIERFADEHGITDPRIKDGLGAATREGKRHGMTYPEMLAAWGVRLTAEEKVLISKIRFDRQGDKPERKISAAEAVDFAFEKHFAKNSVVEQNRLVSEALRYGVGQVKPEQVWRELSRREMIVGKVGDQMLCTSLEVLAEEVSLINKVRSGRGKCAAIQQGRIVFQDQKLSGEQKRAVSHILKSTDQVIAIRGGAGVGKTTLMTEAAAQIEAAGQRIFAFAPSAAASRETLREAGFESANTVAHLLLNKDLQRKIRGQVILIDEAGLLGARDMWEIMKLAGESTRVILTGDSGQHSPVARGDAFRLLEKYSGLKIAEVKEVRRQEQEQYKQAVTALSRGDLQSAFQNLDDLGAIIEEGDDGSRYHLLAQDFLALSRKGSVPLVVSPTHAESARVTDAIRDAKKQVGQIKAERVFSRYHDLRWEDADKKRAENYRLGLIVQFHQNAQGIGRGEIFAVTGVEAGKVTARNAAGKTVSLPLKQAQRFQVFEEREIRIGAGDQIRVTRNGKSQDGRRLHNGNLFEVEKVKKNGDIVLSGGAVLNSNHGHFSYGYCQTSHSSQSKSVRDVLVAQSQDSFVASSREQFYVSVSRGKQSIRIYTDNRQGLQEAVGNTSQRRSGVELARLKSREIAAMQAELTSRQFKDLVKSRVVEGQATSHVKSLLKERRQEGVKKSPEMSWRKYVEMRRGLVGPDGRSRSKGQPQAKDKKAGKAESKQKSFARPTQLTSPTMERMKQAHEGKQKLQAQPDQKPKPQQSRFVQAYKSSVEHFKKVTAGRKSVKQQAEPQSKPTRAQPLPKQDSGEGQAKQMTANLTKDVQAAKTAKQGQSKPAPLPQSNVAQVAEHASRQKTSNADMATKQNAVKAMEQKVQAKQSVPPPPSPKR